MHTRRNLTGDAPDSPLARRFTAIRTENEVPQDFAPEVTAEAAAAAERVLSGLGTPLDLPFFTLDPPGSRDLDQAMHLARDGSGYRVRYAIADVPAFITPGQAIDEAAQARGVTIYAPDRRAPLHPPSLSEDAASLLPGRPRAAFVWDIRLDEQAEIVDVSLTRETVRSVAQMDYPSVQRAVDMGGCDPQIRLLCDIGRLRTESEARRGGASLNLPDQEVVRQPGGWTVTFVPPLEVEDWNAQISLLTGIVGAQIMVDAGVGVLRTMPPAQEEDVAELRRVAEALGVAWPADQSYGALLRTLNRETPEHLALIRHAARLFRGAAYTVLDATMTGDAAPTQAAIAAPYAHVTAPLRRLVDRYTLVTCEAAANGRPIPEWVTADLPEVPAAMAAADRRAGAVERACIDAVEAAVLGSWIGQRVPAVVIDEIKDDRVLVQLPSLGVESRAEGHASRGDTVTVEVVSASIETGTADLRVAAA